MEMEVERQAAQAAADVAGIASQPPYDAERVGAEMTATQ
jgi:hypothetical protein